MMNIFSYIFWKDQNISCGRCTLVLKKLVIAGGKVHYFTKGRQRNVKLRSMESSSDCLSLVYDSTTDFLIGCFIVFNFLIIFLKFIRVPNIKQLLSLYPHFNILLRDARAGKSQDQCLPWDSQAPFREFVRSKWLLMIILRYHLLFPLSLSHECTVEFSRGCITYDRVTETQKQIGSQRWKRFATISNNATLLTNGF